MRPRISIRGCVRRSIGPLVCRSVHWSVSHAFVKIAENGIMQDKMHLMSCIRPSFSGVHLKSQFTPASSVAQWKRAGPITQRSVDRNYALLVIPYYIAITELIIFGYLSCIVAIMSH